MATAMKEKKKKAKLKAKTSYLQGKALRRKAVILSGELEHLLGRSGIFSPLTSPSRPSPA